GFIAGLLALLALLLLISVWFFDNRIASAPTPGPLPAEAVAPAAAQSEIAAEEVLQESVAAEAEGSLIDEAAAADESAEPVAQSQQAVPLDRLQLEFSAECWLEVSDAQGDVLATELQRPGSRLSLQGKAPFQVKLGNASAAVVRFNDEPVTITPPAGSNVVSLSIGR